MRCYRTVPGLLGLFAIAVLPGCASDDSAGRFLVQPDKYVLYNCKELATATQANAKRRNELEALMVKAGPDASGKLVSNLAYRPEYTQLHGEMNELHRTALAKNCKEVPDGGIRASDQAVR